MLLSLVAHAIGYKMIVGTHNTVCVKRMWEALPHSLCMANDDAHNTIDVQRHVGGFIVFACLTGSACFLGPHRAGVPGRSQSAPTALVGEEL